MMNEGYVTQHFIGPESLVEFEAGWNQCISLCIDYLLNRSNSKIHGDISLFEIERLFADSRFPGVGQGVLSILNELRTSVIPHSVRTSSPYFIGHMTGNTPYIGLLADLVISALNQNVVKIETALSASFIEGQTVSWVHRLVYNRSDDFYARMLHHPDLTLGNVTSGGTVGNLTALAVALFKRLPGASELGLIEACHRAKLKRLVVLTGQRAHYSISKVCALLGIGRQNVIRIPVLPFTNKIDILKLRRMATELKARGAHIVALVGVAGSTETGSIDDLNALADVAEDHDTWFHVDAAWGGALMTSRQGSALLAGIERSDSVVLDGHKLFYLPMSHGMVLFRREDDLSVMRHNAHYIIRRGSVDLGRTAAEGSRRFDSLKLWMVAKALGAQGYEKLIDHSLKLAVSFKNLISAHSSFVMTSSCETNILTYRYVPEAWKPYLILPHQNEYGESPAELEYLEHLKFVNQFLNDINIELQKRQRQHGRSFVSRTTLESVLVGMECVVLRAVLFNPLTTEGILAEILEEQKLLGDEIASELWEQGAKSACPVNLHRHFPALSF